MLAQPSDAAIRHVLAQVVRLVVRRLHHVGVLDEPRFPLGCLAGEEAVEVVETVSGRPAVERAHRGRLVGRRVVPLAERRRLVAVMPQHFGHRGRGLRDHAGVAVPVHRAFRDRAGADPLVIAAGEQRGAGGRADSGGVESVVAHPLIGELAQRRRVDLAAERRRLAETDVIEQDDEHVRRVRLEVPGLRAALVHRVLQPRLGDACRGHRRKWQDAAVVGLGRCRGTGRQLQRHCLQTDQGAQ